MTKQVAARLAGELATRPPRSQLESSQATANKYGVSKTMVDNAKRLLTGAKLIYKVERRYYTGQPERELDTGSRAALLPRQSRTGTPAQTGGGR